jgi:hypothetical protein
MIEPNGPLPQSVYWRRRALAGAVSVFAVVLLAWLIGGLVEADDQHPVQGTASASVIGGPTSTDVRGTSAPASAPPSSPGPNDPRGSSTASPRSGSSTSEGAGPATSAAPVPPTTPPAPPPPPPGPPPQCPDLAMKIAATPDAPSYPVGARPLLRLQIMNVGPIPCTRDVSRQLREIVLQAPDGTRLWSSNDCYGPPEADVRVLAPNQPAVFTVNWAGRTSAPGCPLDRKAVPAGTYQVIGKLGALVGPPAPLTLT